MRSIFYLNDRTFSTKFIKLYHNTDLKNIPLIKKSGLLPPSRVQTSGGSLLYGNKQKDLYEDCIFT